MTIIKIILSYILAVKYMNTEDNLSTIRPVPTDIFIFWQCS